MQYGLAQQEGWWTRARWEGVLAWEGGAHGYPAGPKPPNSAGPLCPICPFSCKWQRTKLPGCVLHCLPERLLACGQPTSV